MTQEPENLDAQLTGEADRLVTVAEAHTEFEASLIVSILRDADIEAHAFGSFRQALPFRSHFSGIPVQVRAADEDAAKQALEQRATDSVDIDWDTVDVGRREDRLPFKQPGQTPLAAQIAFSIAIVIVVATLLIALLSLLF